MSTACKSQFGPRQPALKDFLLSSKLIPKFQKNRHRVRKIGPVSNCARVGALGALFALCSSHSRENAQEWLTSPAPFWTYYPDHEAQLKLCKYHANRDGNPRHNIGGNCPAQRGDTALFPFRLPFPCPFRFIPWGLALIPQQLTAFDAQFMYRSRFCENAVQLAVLGVLGAAHFSGKF